MYEIWVKKKLFVLVVGLNVIKFIKIPLKIFTIILHPHHGIFLKKEDYYAIMDYMGSTFDMNTCSCCFIYSREHRC